VPPFVVGGGPMTMGGGFPPPPPPPHTHILSSFPGIFLAFVPSLPWQLVGCSIESGLKEWRFSHRDAVGIDPAETAKNGKKRRRSSSSQLFRLLVPSLPWQSIGFFSSKFQQRVFKTGRRCFVFRRGISHPHSGWSATQPRRGYM